MANHVLESAQLFTPGRASYVTSGPDGSFNLHLSEASANRSEVAASLFDENFHTSALFAGGYPGVSQNWPIGHIPSIGDREAHLMALPLKARLAKLGWDPEDILARVKQQGESNNTIGDVAISIERGFLNPNDFHQVVATHGLHLIAGKLHGIRIRDILVKGLDIDPKTIFRAPVRDVYGTPATEFRPRERTTVALAKEAAAIAATRFVLKDVHPGNLEDLFDAERRFNDIAAKMTN